MLVTLLLATVTFRGVVLHHHRDGRDERVPAAIVDLWKGDRLAKPATTVTAYDGEFSFVGVVPGRYVIGISSGELGTSGTIVIPGTSSAHPRPFFLLDPTCGAAYGRVYDELSDEPLEGATITYLGEASAGADGDYSITWGCWSGPGFQFHNSFFYGASAPGYQPISIFGGRAENVGGVHLQDFSLLPIPRRLHIRPRGQAE